MNFERPEEEKIELRSEKTIEGKKEKIEKTVRGFLNQQMAELHKTIKGLPEKDQKLIEMVERFRGVIFERE